MKKIHKKLLLNNFILIFLQTMPRRFVACPKLSEQYAQQYWTTDGELRYLERLTGKLIAEDESKPVKQQLAYLRHSNRTCNRFGLGCEDHRIKDLFECQVCHLTFYCSISCQDLDKATHAKWCMQKDAVEMGPLRSVVVKPTQPLAN
jgi:hypothetical protein